MNKRMGPILKTDNVESDLIKKLMEFEMTQIFPAGDKQKDPVHTKRQFCVYGTYRWEKMEHNGDAYAAAFPYPIWEPGHPTYLRSLRRSPPGLWQRKLWERRLRCFKCCFWMKGYANL